MPVLIVYGPKLNVERLTDAAASMYGTDKSAILLIAEREGG